MKYRSPQYITNPKTVRRHEREKKKWDEIIQFAKDNGYETIKHSKTAWSFSKDGVKSAFGFDSEGEALMHIFNYHQATLKQQ